jgi:hypothetical protein
MVCVITQELFEDPVFTSDGHTYERWAITKWLTKKNTSPQTGAPLLDKRLRPNHFARSQISEWRSKHRLPPLQPLSKELGEVQEVETEMQPLGDVDGFLSQLLRALAEAHDDDDDDGDTEGEYHDNDVGGSPRHR